MERDGAMGRPQAAAPPGTEARRAGRPAGRIRGLPAGRHRLSPGPAGRRARRLGEAAGPPRERAPPAFHLGGLHARQGRRGQGPRGGRPLVRPHPRNGGERPARPAGARRGQPGLAGAGRGRPPATRRGPQALPPAGEGRRFLGPRLHPADLSPSPERPRSPEADRPLGRGAAHLHRLGAFRVDAQGRRRSSRHRGGDEMAGRAAVRGSHQDGRRRPPGLDRLPGRRLRRRRRVAEAGAGRGAHGPVDSRQAAAARRQGRRGRAPSCPGRRGSARRPRPGS